MYRFGIRFFDSKVPYVEIRFINDKIRALCKDQKIMKKKLGSTCAKKLLERLEGLISASNVSELLAGRPHPLRYDRQDEFAVDLCKGKRLVFKSINDPVPRDSNGRIDWKRVTMVQVTFIGDYHD